MRALSVVEKKISERDSVYGGTWKSVPLGDLIAVARLKTFRATTMLQNGHGEKLLDDLVDAAAYLIFAIERVLSDA